MKPWALLPNADHIDWVIRSAKSNPDIWARAWTATRNTAWREARTATWSAIQDAEKVARDAAYDAARDATWSATRDAAYNVILALIAYDDCDQYLAMTYEQLLIHAVLSEKPQAVLLLTLKWVQENETMVTAS